MQARRLVGLGSSALAAGWMLAALGGCASDETGTGGSGPGTGTAGAGGSPAEGCVDIQVGAALPPGPTPWSRGLSSIARHPFWRDARGLHAVWEGGETSGYRSRLIVTSFDPETGEATQHRVYEPFPLELQDQYASVDDAAGAPDGRFAVLMHHSGDVAQPIGTAIDKVFFGHLDDPTKTFVWLPPWSPNEMATLHVGWDGEAFTVHAVEMPGPWYVVTRLDWNGETVSEVLPPTEIGTIGDILPGNTELSTDPETGITWVGTISHPGVWMSGHHRDGTPLPGVGPMGGGRVQFADTDGYSSEVALAPFGETAFAAWTEYQAYTPAYAARMDTSFATVGEPVSLLPDPKQPLLQKTVARWGDGWALMAKEWGAVTLFTIGDDGAQARRRLVTYAWPDDCPKPGCLILDLRIFSSVAYGDELWFGFWDQSDGIFDGQSEQLYRIVRVKDGCTYKSMFDIRSGK